MVCTNPAQLGLVAANSLSWRLHIVRQALCAGAQTQGSALEAKGYYLGSQKGVVGMQDEEGSLYKVSGMINVD